MDLRLELRHLLLASWPVDAEAAARSLPAPLVAAEVDGESIVSLVSFRCAGGRLGRVPLPPFSQLNARLYVEHAAEPAVFFLRAFVSGAGIGGAFFGASYRPARIRVRRGEISARGLGVRLAYRVDESAEGRPGLLGRHELGIFEAAGLRAIRVRRGPAVWHPAALLGEPRTDLLAALGLDVAGLPRLVYAAEASFATEVPARSLSAAKSSASRSRR